jgi:DNA-binding NarL/FixJ family response regulator
MVLDNRRILVIEDDALVGSCLCEVLEDLGFSVIGPASTGPEALSLAELHKPGIAIVDIQLSGEMDGIDIARAFDDRFAVAVIFLSGTRDEDVVDRAQSVHPVRFLLKPFRASTLLSAIEIARDAQIADKAGSPIGQQAPGSSQPDGTARAVNLRRRHGDHVPNTARRRTFGRVD